MVVAANPTRPAAPARHPASTRPIGDLDQVPNDIVSRTTSPAPGLRDRRCRRSLVRRFGEPTCGRPRVHRDAARPRLPAARPTGTGPDRADRSGRASRAQPPLGSTQRLLDTSDDGDLDVVHEHVAEEQAGAVVRHVHVHAVVIEARPAERRVGVQLGRHGGDQRSERWFGVSSRMDRWPRTRNVTSRMTFE